jgi:hypothetical protein
MSVGRFLDKGAEIRVFRKKGFFFGWESLFAQMEHFVPFSALYAVLSLDLEQNVPFEVVRVNRFFSGSLPRTPFSRLRFCQKA